MRNQGLKYSLSMDRDEFDDAQRVVMATLLTTKRRGPFNKLVRVTEDYNRLSEVDRSYISEWDSAGKGDLEGLCCWKGGGSDEFSIWLSPHMDPLSDLYRVSLLHELVHGYMNHASHDAKFRNILGRVLYHYCDIVSPLKSPGFLVVALNYRYTKQRKDEPSDDFFRRLVSAKEEIEVIAETEYSSVAEMYERIS